MAYLNFFGISCGFLSTEESSNFLGSFFQGAKAFEETDPLESNSNCYLNCVKFEALRKIEDGALSSHPWLCHVCFGFSKFSTNALAVKLKVSLMLICYKNKTFMILASFEKADSLVDSDVYVLVKNIWKPGDEFRFRAPSMYGKV